jgi:transcriptional regulator with XRE-family HTH domain
MTYSTKELTANRVDPEAVAIRTWRRKHGLRLYRLAEIAGIDYGHLHEVEIGKRPLCAVTRSRLQRVYDRWPDDTQPEQKAVPK